MTYVRPVFLCAIISSILVLSLGCRSKSPSAGDSARDANGKSASASVTVVFPDGDPSVSAEDGGPGFTGEGWTTAKPEAFGDPRAVKGGTMSSNIPAWPDNLRLYGIRSNTWLNYLARGLCYESLLSTDPTSLEFVPSLATHWQIEDDGMTFRFRINPRAHWSDGQPVVAQDVIATYRLIADDSLLEPMTKATLVDNMEQPVALSKYLIEVRCKERDWRNFIAISGFNLLPAHEIEGLTGAEYLDKYNFHYPTVSGPYEVRDQDIRTNESLTFTRRKDYWAVDAPQNEGLYNIDKIRMTVIRDDRLAFDKACKGELDFYNVNSAKWWVEDLSDLPAVEKGHLVRRKVFTKFPKGYQGHAINLTQPPLNDLRVRKALAHLYDRRTMLEKFAYNEYLPLNSYFPNSDAANPDNEMVEYDPQAAADLLTEAGWTDRGTDGILRKEGQRLQVNVVYRTSVFEKYLTVFQEDCRKVGVELKLQLLDPETTWNNMMDRKFQMSGINWGAILYPNPRTSWHSEMAAKKGSNNFVGFSDSQVDALIDQYDKEFDLQKRYQLLRQMDEIIFQQHPYVLDWYLPCQRFIYWSKFGMPDTVLLKYQEWEDVFSLWWVDPVKQEALRTARKGESALPVPEIEIRPWDDPS